MFLLACRGEAACDAVLEWCTAQQDCGFRDGGCSCTPDKVSHKTCSWRRSREAEAWLREADCDDIQRVGGNLNTSRVEVIRDWKASCEAWDSAGW